MTRLSKLLHAALLALTLSAPALAAEGGRVPLPNIPAAKGEKCVEPKEVMRRNHMDYLRAHRDATMRQGIRTTKYSLKQCLECHASAPTNETVATDHGQHDGGHFCQSCHQYAGVKPDCFTCHAMKPEATAEAAPTMPEANDASAGAPNQMAGASDKTGAAK